MHDDGRIACGQHVGSTAAADLKRRPATRGGRRMLRGINGSHWVQLLAVDKMAFAREVGVAPSCESCGVTF